VSRACGQAPTIRVRRAFGAVVEGEALISREGFSPRYDLDRWTGLISRPGHALEGHNLRDKILITPSAKGGIAAGWAFYDIKHKSIAPKAFVFGVTNPVMVQGAVFAGITITEGWSRDPYAWIRTGDIVRVDPLRKTLELIKARQ
jgi:predicted aconitase with swiveling domain